MIFIYINFINLLLCNRKIDIQGLIGYIGGYIGLCLGYSFLQIPDFIQYVMEHLKRYYYRRTQSVGASKCIDTSQGLSVSTCNAIEQVNYPQAINDKFSEQIIDEIRKLRDQVDKNSLALKNFKSI